MIVADLVVSCAVGVCITGIAIAVIQAIIEYINKRAVHRAANPSSTSKFLDWLARLVLGPKRIDHEPVYSCAQAAVFLVAFLFLVVGPTPASSLSGLPDKTQVVLATCMFVSSGTCLYGISMGTPFDVWRTLVRLVRKARAVPSQPPLDLRRAYRVGASGTPALCASVSYYALAVATNNPALVGESAFLWFLSLGMFFQWLRFLMQNRQINQALPMLLEQEISRRLSAGGVVDDGSESQADKPKRKWWQP